MLFKKIIFMALCALLLAAPVGAESLKEADPSVQITNNKLPDSAKQRLAQIAQAKQQQAKQQAELPKAEPPKLVETNKAANTSPSAKTTAATTQPQQYNKFYSVRRVDKHGRLIADNNNKKKNFKRDYKKKVQERAFYMNTMLPLDYKNITIVGEAKATMEQAEAYLLKNNPSVKLSCSTEKLVELYWNEAKREGVCPDIAFCQAIVETGFFKYGGDVNHKQNNFCGLGNVGKGARGASFKTAELGVRAHIQHLLAYSRKTKPKTPIVDPRYQVAHDIRLERGLVEKWSGLNGTWAMGSAYCEKIMYHYVRMQETKPLSAKAIKNSRETASRRSAMRERIEKLATSK